MRWFTEQRLKSGSASARRKAASALCENPDVGAFRALQAALADPDAEVRLLAARALGKIDHPERVEVLLRALGDPEAEVVKALILSLRNTPGSHTSAAISPFLRHVEPGVRSVAALVLEAQGWKPPGPEDQAWFFVARGRYSQAAALGALAIPALDWVIQHGPYSLAVSAVQALDQIKDPAAVELLLRALKSDQTAVVVAAADTLGRTGRARAVDTLAGMTRHPDPCVRLAVIEALGSLGATAAGPAVIEALSDSAWEVRRSAAEALGKLKGEGVLEALGRCLNDSDVDVRETAVVALGNLGDPGAISLLLPSLADAASGVRRLAAAALSRVNPDWMLSTEAREAVPGLVAALGTADADARYFAEPLVARLTSAPVSQVASPPPGTPSAEDRRRLAASLLAGLLGASHRDLRQAAAEALGRLPEVRCEQELLRALADEDAGVRNAVRQALAAIQRT
jgi:HEAT repeat protein